MYQEQVPSYKHFDDPGRFVFECILLGNLQPLQAFTTGRLSSFMFKRLYCAFVWLSLFPGNSVLVTK